jgi:oligopeptide/dipeptide ABC transporter ATP-binding protein
MYAGQIVEEGTVADIIDTPRHPYTVALLDALPQPGRQGPQGPLRSIPGSPPSLIDVPGGCRFAARCPLAVDECTTWDTELLQTGQPGHAARCWRHDQVGRDTAGNGNGKVTE